MLQFFCNADTNPLNTAMVADWVCSNYLSEESHLRHLAPIYRPQKYVIRTASGESIFLIGGVGGYDIETVIFTLSKFVKLSSTQPGVGALGP